MCTAAPSSQKKKFEGGREGWLPAVHRLSEEINWGRGCLVPRVLSYSAPNWDQSVPQ